MKKIKCAGYNIETIALCIKTIKERKNNIHIFAQYNNYNWQFMGLYESLKIIFLIDSLKGGQEDRAGTAKIIEYGISDDCETNVEWNVVLQCGPLEF